jgi:hypothetical protein
MVRHRHTKKAAYYRFSKSDPLLLLQFGHVPACDEKNAGILAVLLIVSGKIRNTRMA